MTTLAGTDRPAAAVLTRRSPRIAMVSSRYPPLLGGVEMHVYEVAGRMAGRGVDVTVLTTDPGGDLPAQERQGPLEVRRFPAWPGSGDLYASPGLVLDLLDGGYDLVHVQGVNALLPPMVLAATARAGLPSVVTFHTGGHSSRVRTALRGAQWRALAPLLRRAGALVAVCQFEVERFSRLLGLDRSQIRLIANGAEPLPIGAEPPATSGSPLVVSVGRLERYKGHDRLVAAMPALRAFAPGAHLVVVGRGPYELALRRQVARLGLRPSVTFTAFDHTRRAELGSLVAASDVVALLSDYEAHPVAVMEALALGRKVVVADGSGLAELGSHRQVTLVPPDADADHIAAVLARVAAAPSPLAPTLPTWGDCVDDLLALYDDVLERGAQR